MRELQPILLHSNLSAKGYSQLHSNFSRSFCFINVGKVSETIEDGDLITTNYYNTIYRPMA